MKRVALFLVCALAALISFHACDGVEGLDGIDIKSFILIGDDPEKPVPVFEGQTTEMKIGELVLPAFFVGRDGWVGLQTEGKCIISDPSILIFYRGCLYAMHAGKASVTLVYEENEVHFTVNVPGETSHGTIYFTAFDTDSDKPAEDWEGRISYSDLLIVNGVLTNQSCNLVSSDSDGNLWRGVSRGGRIYLSCNGSDLGENASLSYPHPEELRYFPKRESIRTRHGKLFFFRGGQYKVISADGSVREGTVQGNILDMDMNAQGDIYLWTWYSYAGVVWVVAPDGTSTSHEAGSDHIILDASLDSEGNEYFMCKLGDNKVGIYKNGKALYNLTDAYNPRMIVHGTDVWVASYSPDGEPDANGNVTNWGLYLVKNKDISQIASGFPWAGEIDFCMTKSGVPYVLAGDSAGHIVYKNAAPVLGIPFTNCLNPQLAVTD